MGGSPPSRQVAGPRGTCLGGGRMSSDGRGAVPAVGGRPGMEGSAGAEESGVPPCAQQWAAHSSCDTEVEGKRTSPGEAGVSPSGLDLTLPVSPGAESMVTSGPRGSGASPCPRAAARPRGACVHGSGTRAAAVGPAGDVTSPCHGVVPRQRWLRSGRRVLAGSPDPQDMWAGEQPRVTVSRQPWGLSGSLTECLGVSDLQRVGCVVLLVTSGVT